MKEKEKENLKNSAASDKTAVLAAVKKHGPALSEASDELKSDREIVLAAVKQNFFAFGAASKRLRSDKDILSAANGGDNCFFFLPFPPSEINSKKR